MLRIPLNTSPPQPGPRHYSEVGRIDYHSTGSQLVGDILDLGLLLDDNVLCQVSGILRPPR